MIRKTCYLSSFFLPPVFFSTAFFFPNPPHRGESASAKSRMNSETALPSSFARASILARSSSSKRMRSMYSFDFPVSAGRPLGIAEAFDICGYGFDDESLCCYDYTSGVRLHNLSTYCIARNSTLRTTYSPKTSRVADVTQSADSIRG